MNPHVPTNIQVYDADDDFKLALWEGESIEITEADAVQLVRRYSEDAATQHNILALFSYFLPTRTYFSNMSSIHLNNLHTVMGVDYEVEARGLTSNYL